MNGLYVPWQAVVDGAELDFELVFGKELDQATSCEIFGDQNAPAYIKLSPRMAESIAMLPWLNLVHRSGFPICRQARPVALIRFQPIFVHKLAVQQVPRSSGYLAELPRLLSVAN